MAEEDRGTLKALRQQIQTMSKFHMIYGK